MLGGGPELCCGGILLCGGRPALGGPFVPTLIARAGPGPGGPDMSTAFLLLDASAWCRHLSRSEAGK